MSRSRHKELAEKILSHMVEDEEIEVDLRVEMLAYTTAEALYDAYSDPSNTEEIEVEEEIEDLIRGKLSHANISGFFTSGEIDTAKNIAVKAYRTAEDRKERRMLYKSIDDKTSIFGSYLWSVHGPYYVERRSVEAIEYLNGTTSLIVRDESAPGPLQYSKVSLEALGIQQLRALNEEFENAMFEHDKEEG